MHMCNVYKRGLTFKPHCALYYIIMQPAVLKRFMNYCIEKIIIIQNGKCTLIP